MHAIFWHYEEGPLSWLNRRAFKKRLRGTYASTRQPTERERKLHEITHLPFRQCCPFCVAGKSRADYKRSVEVADVQQREHPVIQLDIMFAAVGNSVMLLMDTWTRYALFELKVRVAL